MKGKRKHEHGECPICGGALEYFDDDACRDDGESLLYPWECPTCGSEGEEVYNLVFANHNINIEGEAPEEKDTALDPEDN